MRPFSAYIDDASCSWFTVWTLAAALLSIFLLYSAVHSDRNFLYGDGSGAVFAVRSIVEDFDLDLKNQFEFRPENTVDQIALGAEGQWYPLHEVLLPVLSVPFYLMLKLPGLLVVNILSLLIACTAMFLGMNGIFSPVARWVAIVIIAASQVVLQCAHNYLFDVTGAMLIALAFGALLQKKFTLAGIFFGMLGFGRLPDFVMLPGFIAFIVCASPSMSKCWRSLLSFGLAASFPFLLFLLCNFKMWGSPFTIAYQHWVSGASGIIIPQEMSHHFSWPSWSDFGLVFFQPVNGLFVCSPFVLILLVIGTLILLLRHFSGAMAFLFSAVPLLLLVSGYHSRGFEPWRYCLPVFIIGALPLTSLLDGVGSKLKCLWPERQIDL